MGKLGLTARTDIAGGASHRRPWFRVQGPPASAGGPLSVTAATSIERMRGPHDAFPAVLANTPCTGDGRGTGREACSRTLQAPVRPDWNPVRCIRWNGRDEPP